MDNHEQEEEKNHNRKQKSDELRPNARKLQSKQTEETVTVNMMASKVGEKRTQEALVTSDRKSFTTGLHNILDANLLGS